MQKQPLFQEEIDRYGANLRVVLTHEDLTETGADTDQTIALFDVADKVGVELVAMDLKTPFQDASDAALNSTALSVGDGSDPDRLLAAKQLNANGSTVNHGFGTGTRHAFAAADTVDALVESMVGKSLSNIDAGEVHLYFRVWDLR